jgi:hypothetical protein
MRAVRVDREDGAGELLPLVQLLAGTSSCTTAIDNFRAGPDSEAGEGKQFFVDI